MSEFIAEAKVLITPDLSRFRRDLDAQLTGVLSQQARRSAALTRSSQEVAGALTRVGDSAGKAKAGLTGLGTATGRLDAALLGLRTAAGSAAVIGLGAGALAAIALGKAFRSVIGLTAQFESELAVFRATTGATTEELQRVSQVAQQLGRDISLPGVSAVDAAEAMTELSKAGLSVQDSIAGARGVLQLATAAAISNAAATELAANALNAFGLAGDQAVHVADVLANAANAAQGSITDMGLALSQAAAVGRQVGLTFEDTSAFLTILAKNGLRGSDAGTSLRVALLRLINPTEKAADEIKNLGIQIRDAQGRLRVDIFQQFAEATRDLSPALRDAKLALIGGQDAIRAFSILGRQSIKTLLQVRAQLREQGTAAEVAAARTTGLTGAAANLRNTLEGVGLSLGRKLAPGLTALTDSVTAAISGLSQSEGLIALLNTSFSTFGQTLSLLGSTAATVAGPVLQLAGALGQLTAAIGGPEILVGLAAFKFGPAIFKSLSTAISTAAFSARIFLTSLTALSAGLTSFSAASATLRVGLAGLAGLLTGPTGIALGAAAAAAGLIFLITRESETERVTRRLKEATEALVQAQDALLFSTQGLASAQRSVSSAKLSEQQSKLAVATARAALAGTTAAKGSLERRQLELSLAIAVQNVTFAQQDLSTALERANEAQEENLQAIENANAAKKEEAKRIQDVVDAQERLNLSRARQIGGVDAGLKAEAATQIQIVNTLRERAAAEREENTNASRAAAKRLELLAKFIELTKTVPTDVQIGAVINAASLKEAVNALASSFEAAGRDSADSFRLGLLAGLPGVIPEVLSGLLVGAKTRSLEIGHTVAIAVAQGIKERAEAIGDALESAIKLAGVRAERAATALDVAIVEGASKTSQRGILQKQFDERQKEFEAAQKLLGRGESPSRRKAFEDAATARRAAFDELKAFDEQVEADAENAARESEQSRKKADEAVIKIFDLGQQRIRNRLITAAGTETLSDDIRFTVALRALLRRQIVQARKRIKDIQEQRDFIRSLQREILNLTNDIIEDRKKFQEEIRRRTEERQQRLIESLQLDIEFAQTNKNLQNEIKARERLIATLRKAQARVKRGTVEWKRLRNEIAAEQQAIKELKEQQKESQKDARQAIAEFFFTQLQAQQGFAANLLGNLIPTGATAGLVGNVSTAAAPGRAAREEADKRTGRAAGGPTSGQANTTNEILRAILRQLHRLNQDREHPEATRQRRNSGGVMDGVGGGGSEAVM